MPKQKDLKRLARARMRKTGESYTAARSQLLKKKTSPAKTTAAETDLARLARMSDEAVEAKTGQNWTQWVRALDAVDAAAWPHREIAAYVYETFDISRWWAQTVTVGYERIRGLRDVGQRRGGTYECTKSKTFHVALPELYKLFATSRQRSRWLDGAPLTVHKVVAEKSVRALWKDGTPVEIYFTAKGHDKSQAALQHRKLPSKTDAARMKAYWEERFTVLGQILSAARR